MSIFNIVREELYKIFIKKHFLWIFLAVFIFEMVQFNYQPKPSAFNNFLSENLYKEEVKKLQGVYDEDKAQAILEKAEYTFSFHNLLSDKIYNLLEYQEMFKEYPNINESVLTYKLLKSQIEYIQQDPMHRYYMEVSGWETLITDIPFEYLFVFLVIGMAASIYSNEYETKVDTLNRSSSLGRTTRYLIQTLILVFSLFSLMVLIYLGRYLIIFDSVKGTGSYPIQSLPSFANALFSLSIIQTFGLLMLIRMVGVIYSVSLISFISKFFKSSLLSLFVGLVVILIPYLILNPFELYLYPIPTAWFMGTGLIRGQSIMEYLAPFAYVSYRDLLYSFTFTSIVIVGMWWITLRSLRKGD